jgi:hypothetical protein
LHLETSGQNLDSNSVKSRCQLSKFGGPKSWQSKVKIASYQELGSEVINTKVAQAISTFWNKNKITRKKNGHR